jgi:peptidoglycan/LPS O-acetylase OafA/YrhL
MRFCAGWACVSKQRISAPNLPRSQNLDLIRAVAISMVLIYHGVQMSPMPLPWLAPITNYGQYGVDLFFVLSGWLIGGLYWRERASCGDVHVLGFWIRRWIRTIPPYLAALLTSWLAVRYMRREPFDYSYLFFFQNYYQEVPFFLVSWSLCVEEHFYLLIPIMFMFWKGKQEKRIYLLAAVALIAPAASRFLEYSNTGTGFGYALTATHLRMEGLLLGFLLSYVSTYSPADFRVVQRLSPYIVVFSLILMALLGFTGPRTRYTLWGTVVSLFFSSGLVYAVSCREIGVCNRLISLGAISSYSLYLTHALAIDVARMLSMQLPKVGSLAYFPIALTIVAGYSIIFFYAIERTSIIIRDTYWPRRTVTNGEQTYYRSELLTN